MVTRVIGQLADGRKIPCEVGVGPATPVSVDAGATVDIDIPIVPELRVIDTLVVSSIAGLVGGLCLQGITWTATGIKLRVFNPTATAITQGANTVTVTYITIGY